MATEPTPRDWLTRQIARAKADNELLPPWQKENRAMTNPQTPAAPRCTHLFATIHDDGTPERCQWCGETKAQTPAAPVLSVEQVISEIKSLAEQAVEAYTFEDKAFRVFDDADGKTDMARLKDWQNATEATNRAFRRLHQECHAEVILRVLKDRESLRAQVEALTRENSELRKLFVAEGLVRKGHDAE